MPRSLLPLVVLAALLALPAPALAVETHQLSFCTPPLTAAALCVSRDGTWYCHHVRVGFRVHADCFQFIGP